MINISRRQIINNMKYTIIIPDQVQVSNILREVFNVANSIEVLTGIRGILTSNKLWELLVACKLGHRINPEQRKHDAYPLYEEDIRNQDKNYIPMCKPFRRFITKQKD